MMSAQKNKHSNINQSSKNLSNSKTYLHSRYRIREGCFILSVAVSCFILLALLSYHREDPIWYRDNITTPHIINAGGRVGACISNFFLYLFGYLAYLFPVILCYEGWLFYKHGKTKDQPPSHKLLLLFLRILGAVLIVLSTSSLLALHILQPFSPLPFQSGGIIGSIISLSMLYNFNSEGSSLILIYLLLLGISLFTRISWFQLIEGISAFILRVMLQLYQNMPKKLKELFNPLKTPLLNLKKVDQTTPNVFLDIPHHNPWDEIKKFDIEKSNYELKIAPDYGKLEILPKISLLDFPAEKHKIRIDEEQLKQRSHNLEMRLADFKVKAQVVAVHPGPVVTRYELQLAVGTKINKITTLVKDLARSLSVISVRVVEVIPGKSVIGIELPNEQRETVNLREILSSEAYNNSHYTLTLALGKDIAGHPVVVDLSKMPHLLVAGTTGSGKSVNLNAMLLSLLYKSTPRQLRLILIDPKMLELPIYDGIPHLLTPVITDMKDAAAALRWCVIEMERRYKLMSSLGVRHVAGYNAKIRKSREQGTAVLTSEIDQEDGSQQPYELQELPRIVVLADEFSDMMVVVGKKVETLITRLAQKARAAGVHLILATQRPSVDVITGLIKANIPTRMAFQVSSKIDSRTILDQQGAEQLLGHGDMLYLPPGSGLPVRVHGAYVSDDEVNRVVNFFKEHSPTYYVDNILDDQNGDSGDYIDRQSTSKSEGRSTLR